MPDPVILAACRTAVGTAYRGTLTETTAFDLAEVVTVEALRRSGLDAGDIDDVILAENLYGGGVIARYVTAKVGLTGLAGMALNRHCAGGMSAVQVAAASIAAGMDRAVIAGGTNSQSTSPSSRWQDRARPSPVRGEISSHPGTPEAPSLDMSITVGWNTAQSAGLTREEMDAWGYRSHQRAVAAIDEGRFVEEIVPMNVTKAGGHLVGRSTSTPAAPARSRSWRPPAAAPRDRGLLDHRRQLGRTQRRGRGRLRGVRRLRAAHGLDRWPPSARGPRWVWRPPAPAWRRRRHPEGARPGRPRSATCTCGRSTRRSPPCRSPPWPALGIDEEHRERVGQRLQPGPPDLRHRGPDDGHPGLRAAAPGRRDRRRRHVRRRRHGSATVIEVPG